MRPAVLLHQISGEESEGLPGVIDLLMAPDMEPDSIAHAELGPFAEGAVSSGAEEVSEIQGVEVAPLTLRRASMLWNEHTSQRGGSDCKIESAGHIREGGYKPDRTWSIGRSTLIIRAP